MANGPHTAANVPPEVRQAIATALTNGAPLRTLQAEHNVSPPTILAIKNDVLRESPSPYSADKPATSESTRNESRQAIVEIQRTYAPRVRDIARIGLEKYQEAIEQGKCDIDRVPLNVAILLDKLATVDTLGKPVTESAPTVQVNIGQINAFLNEAKPKEPKVIEMGGGDQGTGAGG